MKYNKEWRSDWVRKATTTVAKASAERDSSELLIASAAAELEQVKASLTSGAKAKLTADLARQRPPSQARMVASSSTELSNRPPAKFSAPHSN
jgi:hypothetical protein